MSRPVFDSASMPPGVVLLCPNCRGDYMHHERVHVHMRHREDDNGFAVEIDRRTSTQRPLSAGSSAFLGRRDDIVIHFYCENCSGESDYEPTMRLCITQHKGQTILEWGCTSLDTNRVND